MVRAKWNSTRILGLTCCLGILSAVSAAAGVATRTSGVKQGPSETSGSLTSTAPANKVDEKQAGRRQTSAVTSTATTIKEVQASAGRTDSLATSAVRTRPQQIDSLSNLAAVPVAAGRGISVSQASSGKGSARPSLTVVPTVKGGSGTRTAMGSPADWTEDWESYPDSSNMHGLGGWKGWDNSPGATAFLQEAISRSANSAIDVVGAADLVQPFFGHDSGVWDLYAYQWVPSGLNAPNGQYFIVQKEYNDGGPYQWSIQMWVATNGTVHCDCGLADNGTPGVMWIPDAWNEIHAVIDLDADWVELFYNGTLLGEYQWTTGVFGTNSGCPASGCIGAIDLFAFSGTSVYYDDLEITDALACDPECPEGSECIQGACCGDGEVTGGEECDPGGGCGTCPWDTFPVDGEVGAGDLANLLGNWGELPPNADPLLLCLIADEDNNIGPLELANLLGNWGPCPPPLDGDDGECSDEDCLQNCQCVGRGACCGAKGPDSCDEDLTADECAAAGGSYVGDDTTCDDCPDPACFDAEGSCSEPHGGPGCQNPVCCGIICNVDPACCESWDEICVTEAADLCPPPVCGDGFCEGGESACTCPGDCVGECPCTVFTSQVEFEAFNEEEGKALKGVEDFEEGNLGPAAVAGLDDPLCGGIPSAPAGTPYPNGLDQLNMCLQSNTLAGDATVPAPAGAAGLAAASAGFSGAVSDIVLCNTFVNSLDLMFTSPPAQVEDDHTGIGFNTLALLGGTSVDIQVYNKSNALLVAASSPADPAGSNFWGVWCADPIGRINIFDPGNGAEGGDNIQLWVQEGICGDGKCTAGEDCENCPDDCGDCPVCGNMIIEPGEECDPPGPGGCGGEVCLPDCTCGDLCGDGICSAGENECNCNQDCPGVCDAPVEFTNQVEFEAAAAAAGKILKGIEDFEEGTLPPAAVDGMDDPLCSGIPNAPDAFPYPVGLTGVLNLCLQSNIGGADPSVPSPQGVDGLAAASAGFLGAVSDVVISNTFVNGLDLIFATPKTAVGFEVLNFLGGPSVVIKVYNTANVEILSTTSLADATGLNFWGVLSSDPIGRINIFDGPGAEGGDAIQLWEQP